MKTLIVEDDFICRRLLKEFLARYGDCDIATDGREGLESFKLALESGNPYQLVCMDVMMPNMDGQEALKQIRELEKEHGIYGSKEAKVIMTTALDDPKSVIEAYYKGGATSYVVKPILREKLLEELRNFGLI